MVSMFSSRTTVYTTILFISLSAGVLALNHLSAEAIFDDLIKWNKVCAGEDSCREDRRSNNLGGSYDNDVHCHCDRRCQFLGTCCADSKYRTHYGLGAGFNCRNPNPSEFPPFFMVDRCNRNWNGEDFVQDLCIGSATTLNDPLLLVPATSPETGITYRNYFCFACNEDLDAVSPVLWKLQLLSFSKDVTGESLANLLYDERTHWWRINGTYAFVIPIVRIPEAFKEYEIRCVESVIQTCAKNWTDLVTKQKCEAYMALVWGGSSSNRRVYRNPHCAVCNFLDVSEIRCQVGGLPGGVLPPLIREFYLYLENRCQRYEMFDPISKRCRRVRCGENQVWYQGECRDRN